MSTRPQPSSDETVYPILWRGTDRIYCIAKTETAAQQLIDDDFHAANLRWERWAVFVEDGT